MSRVLKNGYSIDNDTRQTISMRKNRIANAINEEFWFGSTDTAHVFYVGSYGRHTAIDTSDVDILLKLPLSEYDRFNSMTGNGQSRLLQAVKKAIQPSYPKSDISADGQVVVIKFSDGIKFELLPAFERQNVLTGKMEYIYPDTNMGGNWKSTNPKAEIDEMNKKDQCSRGLLTDTCKHLRYIRDNYYSSYHLSGIFIDTFVYNTIGDWRWTEGTEKSATPGSYEQELYDSFSRSSYGGLISPRFSVPGSNMLITPNPHETIIMMKMLEKMKGD